MATQRILTNKNIAESIYLLTKGKSGKELADTLGNVVRFLDRKRLLGRADAILTVLRKRINQAEGIIEAKVTTVSDLSNHAKHDLKEQLIKRYHAKEIILNEDIDKGLLGGMRIEVDDEVIDLTLKNKVAKLQEYLISQ